MIVRAVKELSGHAGAIYDVLVVGNSHCFTTSADKFVAKWNLSLGAQDQFAAKLDLSGYRLAFSPVNQLLAVGNSGGGIHVIDMVSKKEVRYLTQHQSAVFSLTYNPVTHHFYSGDADGYFCVWDGNSFDLLLTLPILCGKIRCISLSEMGDVLAFGGQDGRIYLLETNFFNPISDWKAHKEGVNTLLFKNDVLFSGGKDAHIRKWKWKSQHCLQEIPAHNFAVYDLIWLKDRSVLVSASFDKTIKLWDPEKLTILKRIERRDGGHSHVVNRLQKVTEHAFLSVGDDRRIILWEVQ